METMNPNLLLSLSRPGEEEEPPPGEKKKFLPPTSRKNPRFEELQKVLTEWVNMQLLAEHIVVRSLEEDMFDGLVLHHLFQHLSGQRLEVEEIALTASSQRRKLSLVLEAIGQSLQAGSRSLAEQGLGREVLSRHPKQLQLTGLCVLCRTHLPPEAIFNKDLLATLHLLLALAAHFQPNLALPRNVQVEVILMESTKNGLKSEKLVEQLTGGSPEEDRPSWDGTDGLFQLSPEELGTVKENILSFVNQKLSRLGLSVESLDSQFADGVILLLLIGQLEGFFLHLKEFYLTPSSTDEMLHNVTLALELLKELDLLGSTISPEDIVNKDPRSTLQLLYSLHCRHQQRGLPGELPPGLPD